MLRIDHQKNIYFSSIFQLLFLCVLFKKYFVSLQLKLGVHFFSSSFIDALWNIIYRFTLELNSCYQGSHLIERSSKFRNSMEYWISTTTTSINIKVCESWETWLDDTNSNFGERNRGNILWHHRESLDLFVILIFKENSGKKKLCLWLWKELMICTFCR